MGFHVVLPKSALSATRRQPPDGLAHLPRDSGPRAAHCWALQTNTCTGSVQTTRTYGQLDLHFVLNTFSSTQHSYEEGRFAPLITANQQEQTLSETI